MSYFDHKLLADMSSEERWLKYFPRDVFIRMVIKLAIIILVFRLGGLHTASIIINSLLLLWAIVSTILSLLEKDPKKYLSGGGSTLSDLIKKKRYFRSHKATYALGMSQLTDSKEVSGK